MLAASAHHGVWVCAFRCMNTLQLIYPFFDVHLGLVWGHMNEAAMIHSCVFGGFVFILLGLHLALLGHRVGICSASVVTCILRH